MGKRGRKSKGLIFSFIFVCICILFVYQSAMGETFLWQDFEFWNCPTNHGWMPSCPPYPVWGPCPVVSYGRIHTDIDPQLQSRVYMNECMPSPFNQFYRFRSMNRSIPDPDTDTSGFDMSVISFNVFNYFAIEYFLQWGFQLQVVTRNGNHILLDYRPVGETESGPMVGGVVEYGMQMGKINGGDPGDPENPLAVTYNLGRQFQDGTWHLVVRDLDQDIRNIDEWEGIDFEADGFGDLGAGAGSSNIQYFILIGITAKIDNIAFYDKLNTVVNHPPKLQRIGPQFIQLYSNFSRIINANDRDDPNNTDSYDFIASIGGYGYQGVQTENVIFRIKPDPNSSDNYIKCDSDDIDRIGNKVLMEITPQVFEDLIITLEVKDPHGLSDIETFPLSVVNYPIVNHPPYFEEIEDDIFQLGTNDEYFIKEFICYDQDEEDNPGQVDPTPVPGNITYSAFIDGLQNYQYGPWQEAIIPNPCLPIIKFSPKFEGTHTIIVTAKDQRGFIAITDFTLVVVATGTWLNHSPIICEDIDSPQLARAGQMFIIPIEFLDPDGDYLNYSCNIGSVTEMKKDFGITPGSTGGQTTGNDIYGRYVSGAVFTFMTHFPGRYYIQITAYDIRGGYCTAEFLLDVKPWWSL